MSRGTSFWVNIDVTSIIVVLILIAGGYFGFKEYDKYKHREAAAAEKARLDDEKERHEMEVRMAAAAEQRRADNEAHRKAQNELEQQRIALERAKLEKESQLKNGDSSASTAASPAKPKIEKLTDAEEQQASQARERAKKLLRDSEMKPQLVVDAAKELAVAAELYERAGMEAESAETNSFLYWCKKEMENPIASIKKDGLTPAVSKRLDAAVKEVDKDEARVFLKRAEEFSSAYPQDYMLVAMRYFEVADRFKGTQYGTIAQERSLRAMHWAASSRTGTISRAPETKPVSTPVAPPPGTVSEPAKTSPEKPADTAVVVADQKLAVENASKEAIGGAYLNYMSAFDAASAKIKAQEPALKESSMVTVRDAFGRTSKQFSQELYNNQYANLVNSTRITLDPVWRTVETRRDAFLTQYRTAAREKASDENKRALQFAIEICEKQYKKMH